MSACSQEFCRGGLVCCQVDPSLNAAYCLTQTSCSPSSSTAGSAILLVLLLLAALTTSIVLYFRWKQIAPKVFSMGDFVERELRLEPQEKFEHTKFKTITSFE